MSNFLQSLAHAIRVLRKNPGFTLAALAVLTLGIGANTAIFSVVNAVLLKPLPFPDSDSIVTVYHVPPAAAFPGLKRFAVSAANYLDWRRQNDVFESISVFGARNHRLGGGSRPQSILTTISDADFFTVLGTKPAMGRAFTEAECQPGRDAVIVLSHGFAQSQFGSPANALGKHLVLDGRNHQVIGVMPPRFHVKSWLPASTQGWIPLAWTEKERSVRGDHNFLVVARLRNGVTVAKAQSALNTSMACPAATAMIARLIAANPSVIPPARVLSGQERFKASYRGTPALSGSRLILKVLECSRETVLRLSPTVLVGRRRTRSRRRRHGGSTGRSRRALQNERLRPVDFPKMAAPSRKRLGCPAREGLLSKG